MAQSNWTATYDSNGCFYANDSSSRAGDNRQLLFNQKEADNTRSGATIISKVPEFLSPGVGSQQVEFWMRMSGGLWATWNYDRICMIGCRVDNTTFTGTGYQCRIRSSI